MYFCYAAKIVLYRNKINKKVGFLMNADADLPVLLSQIYPPKPGAYRSGGGLQVWWGLTGLVEAYRSGGGLLVWWRLQVRWRLTGLAEQTLNTFANLRKPLKTLNHKKQISPQFRKNTFGGVQRTNKLH